MFFGTMITYKELFSSIQTLSRRHVAWDRVSPSPGGRLFGPRRDRGVRRQAPDDDRGNALGRDRQTNASRRTTPVI